MRMSHLFGRTLRDSPASVEATSHSLLLRAGYIRQAGTGIYNYLHLAQRSLMKIEAIMRQEMDKIEGQEISMSVVQPADIWKDSERWYLVGSEMGRFKDKNDRDMVLAMTHEEMTAFLAAGEIQSYKQLPQLVYHIQTKWRDDPRPRAGLIRTREFKMLDSYSLDKDYEGLDRQYQAHYQAYYRIFGRCGLPVVAANADVGMMGGKGAHEFMYLNPVGEDTLLICDHCGYIANRQIATFRKPVPVEEPEEPVLKVATPGAKTIHELADFLSISEEKTAKAVFFIAEIKEGKQTNGKFVFVVIRGDMDVNEYKLANVIQATSLRPATDEDILQIGAVPGYASPVGISGAIVIVDDLIPDSKNLVAGANETGFHLKNVNYGRDFQANHVADIAYANAGHACPHCGEAMISSRGVEVANIFKLGSRYSEKARATYLDQNGVEKPLIMGSYGIGLGRLLACIAEEHHDDMGLVMPLPVAPYHVHLLSLKGTEEKAEEIYKLLVGAGVEVLFDDRKESPGVKFNDADLIGLPIRVTVGERTLKQGGVEVKLRDNEQRSIEPVDAILPFIQNEINRIQNELNKSLNVSLSS